LPKAFWDFGLLAEVAFGPRAASAINAVSALEVWLALVAFMVMNGGNAAIVAPEISTSVSIPVCGAIATLFCFVPHSVFAYLSLISTLAMVIAAVAMVLSTCCMARWANPYDHMGEAAVFRPENFPRSIGIIVFCFAGHPCFPAVLTSMENAQKWGTVCDRSFLVAFVYYTSFGFLGFLVFGTTTSASLSENLGEIHGATFFRYVAASCFLLKIQLTIPLLMNVCLVACWKPGGDEDEESESLWPCRRVLLLFAISAATMLVAMASADLLAVIASLTGSLFINITSVLFPAIVHLALSRKRTPHLRMSWSTTATYVAVISFGIVQAIFGTALAVQDAWPGKVAQ